MSLGLNSQSLLLLTLVLLLSPKVSFIYEVSLEIISITLDSLLKISFKSAIKSNFSFNSSSIFFLSSQASLFNFISKIASACISVNQKFFISENLASSLEFEALIVAIISSIWSSAFLSHSST